jgi:hypothetical protein
VARFWLNSQTLILPATSLSNYNLLLNEFSHGHYLP